MDSELLRRLQAEVERLARENAQLRAVAGGGAESIDPELHHLLDVLPILVFVIDAEDRFEKYRAGRGRLALPPEAFLGRAVAEVFPAPLADRLLDAIAQARATRVATTVDYELVVSPDSDHFVADFVPLPNDRTAVFVHDVTHRHRAERAVRENERRFRTLIEKATDVLYVVDAELRITFWSPGATEALGWTAEEAVGAFGPGFIHPDDLHLISVPDPGESGQSLRMTYRVRHKDGGYRTLEANVRNGLGDPAVNGVIINARDVTEQRVLEARAAESQKLESIGRLAGGVAHDFNNLLTVILNCAELQREAIVAGQLPSADDATEIVRAGHRARDLTHQLLAFARRQVIAPVVLDVNALLAESQKLTQRLLGEDVALSLRLTPAPWFVRCDPAQLQQVVLNLAANARDAMPRGGQLEIATENVDVGPELAGSIPGLRAGPHLRLSVRDHGEGLSPDARAHLFEPFFTTKERGRGTGLGLATTYGIVSQSGGGITVDSEPGRGTSFELYFPRAEGAPEGASRPEPARASGHEKVLLVEDERAVAQVIARILGGAGYVVLGASDGAEAIAIAEREPAIDLLLTDVVMPGLDGRQVADAVAALHPRAKVLFISGFTHDVIGHHGVVDAGVNFLPKPFTPSTLLARVREVLGA